MRIERLTHIFQSMVLCPAAVCDLAINATASSVSPAVNDVIEFTITISNAQSWSDATGVQVTALLPSGHQYVSHSQGASYDSAAGVWTVGSLNNGESKELVIRAQVLASGVYLLSAEICAGQGTSAGSGNLW